MAIHSIPAENTGILRTIRSGKRWRHGYGQVPRQRRILRLPPRFKMLDVGADYVLGRRLDENDAVVIEVYRLIKGPAR